MMGFRRLKPTRGERAAKATCGFPVESFQSILHCECEWCIMRVGNTLRNRYNAEK